MDILQRNYLQTHITLQFQKEGDLSTFTLFLTPCHNAYKVATKRGQSSQRKTQVILSSKNLRLRERGSPMSQCKAKGRGMRMEVALLWLHWSPVPRYHVLLLALCSDDAGTWALSHLLGPSERGLARLGRFQTCRQAWDQSTWHLSTDSFLKSLLY